MIQILFKHYEDGRDIDSWFDGRTEVPAVGDTVTIADTEFTVTHRHWVDANQVIVRVKFGTGRQM